MSALSSGLAGAEEFYKVVPPQPGDLSREPFVGACYSQRGNICGISDRATTIWVVSKVGNGIVTLQPNAGGSNRARYERKPRRLSPSILRTEYTLCMRQRQYPPC